MRNGKKKPVMAIISLLDIVFLLILLTWAWIEGTANPGLRGTNMQISVAPGLVMKIDGTQTDIINLNKYCSDDSKQTITLAEASSATGTKIFFRSVSENTTENDETVYLRETSSPDTDKNVNYLLVTFTLTAANGAQKLWIDPAQSYIRDSNGNPLNAIRVSLEVKHMDNGVPSEKSETTILSMREADSSGFCLLKGVKDFDRANNRLVDDTAVGGIDGECMAYVQVYPLTGYSSNHPWMELSADETIQVTMRVWLEGMDEDCIDSISGNSLDFHMFFCAEATEATNK